MDKMRKIMSFFHLFFSAVLSAALLAAGIPNEFLLAGSALCGLFALVPLYTALLQAPSFAAAGLLCGTHIACVHLLSSFWLANFKDFAVFTLGASTAAYFGLGISVGWCLRLLLRSSPSVRPFAFAAGWVCWEWLKSTGFLAYPWGTLPMTASSLRFLVQIADITGIWGLSFLFALCPAVTAELLAVPFLHRRTEASFRPEYRKTPLGAVPVPAGPAFRSRMIPAAVFLLLCAAALLYGRYARGNLPEPEKTFRVSVIQQNSDPWTEGNAPETALRNLQDLTRAALEDCLRTTGTKPDLVVWSETSLPYAYNINRRYYRLYPEGDSFLSFLAETGCPLFTGSPHVETENGKRKAFNAALLLNPQGEILDWYGKIQLVPFAEYMPFTEYKIVAAFFDALVGFSSGWTPGRRLTVFRIPVAGTGSAANGAGSISFTAPICFEDAFPSVTAALHNQGSGVLINLTNDSWSKTASAEYQHFAVARFRAVELRTTLLRVTNSGVTAVIRPDGSIQDALPLFRPCYLNAEIPVYRTGQTVYAVYGDWFAAVCAAFSLAAMAAAVSCKKNGVSAFRGNI